MARGNLVWYNGKVLPVEEAKISLFSHVIHYGVGAFEGIRAYEQSSGGGAVFRLIEHLERLQESCKILGLLLPYSTPHLVKAVVSLCKANGFKECYIRPVVYIADGPLGLNAGTNPPLDVAILNWEWGSYLGDQGVAKGARLKISSFTRGHVNSSMSKGKIIGQYVLSVMAKHEAIADGFDEAILLDTEGYVTEGTGENLFIVKNGIVKTAPLNSILNGITRQTVIQHLTEQGRTVQEVRFTRDEMWCADEVFMTGTAAEVTPVREVDRRSIGRGDFAGQPGPVTRQLQDEFKKLVRGALPAYGKHWLTPIE